MTSSSEQGYLHASECELCGGPFEGKKPIKSHCFACFSFDDLHETVGYSVRSFKDGAAIIHHCHECHRVITDQLIADGYKPAPESGDPEVFPVGYTVAYIEIAYSMAISRVHEMWT